MTLQEYQRTPETVLPQELVDGVVRVADAPFVPHQRLVLKLAMSLEVHVQRLGLGEIFVAPVDVVLDSARPLVVQPDLLFVSAARAAIVRDRIDGPPDLVVEVLSPNPRIGRLDERVDWFAQYGVAEIWLLHQFRRQLEILTCRGRRIVGATVAERADIVRSSVLPGLQVPLGTMLATW